MIDWLEKEKEKCEEDLKKYGRHTYMYHTISGEILAYDKMIKKMKDKEKVLLNILANMPEMTEKDENYK